MLSEGQLTLFAPKAPANRLICRGPRAGLRVRRAIEFVRREGAATEIVIVAPSLDAAGWVARGAAAAKGGSFGWHRFTLARLAGFLAAPILAARGQTPAGALPREAVCARLVHRLGAAKLGRFGRIADRPGLPRALARALDELRLAQIPPSELGDRDVAELLLAYESELVALGMADRAEVLRVATEAVDAGERHPLTGKPLVLIDVAIESERERGLVAALASRAERWLATVPTGDERTWSALSSLGNVDVVDEPRDTTTALGRLQAGLFSSSLAPGRAGDDVAVLSAPGESREAVEIARYLQREAERGVPFDRMAILLRSPLSYRAHLAEALRRAGIPVHFARGTIRPHAAGRAFLALLACATEGLSARRFAEYLSVGEVAKADTEGAPPKALSSTERWVPPDEETLPSGAARASEPADPSAETEDDREIVTGDAATALGSLRAPRLWERLLVDAAVIGGLGRWQARLAGLRHKLVLDLEELRRRDPDDARSKAVERDIAALDSLRGYALPLLADLADLAPPKQAAWGEWIDRLQALATRTLRHPERVLSVLAELCPMAEVGPVDLHEVRLVLERRLTDLAVPPTDRPFGRVYVAAVEEARGLSFDVVFLPGLAERLFPQKVTEDPILPDRERARQGARLRTNADRSARERLFLRIAVGAADHKLVVSYPRLDVEQSRPRTPSFYGLEVLRAAEGRLPGFDELARRAEMVGGARLGWPAPERPIDAIDAAEHDLSLLHDLLNSPEKQTEGKARYLLGVNPHLARALRFRARRWLKAWTRADGLVDPDPAARPALAEHGLDKRSFSPTALQQYAVCPYKFVLYAVHKLAPREEPVELEELDPLQRGSLIHEVEFELLGRLRDHDLLPVAPAKLDKARALLDVVLDEVAKRYKEELSPAIERVWDDGIASIRADLREMLRQSADETEWVPAHFELSFGLTDRRARDPSSVDEPLVLGCGIRLRGSIDLVEKRADGSIRATDYKTGKARVSDGAIIGGGETLQPVLYALALEQRFPDTRVDSGRLYYCTSNGEFREVVIPLDDEARQAAADVAAAVGGALKEGFLPAAPQARACEYCDYQPVCGPYEELRVSKKKQDRLVPLANLRKRV
jgi:CRISPR/Cas system-associated exonuclease Cas4 (RecB family)